MNTKDGMMGRMNGTDFKKRMGRIRGKDLSTELGYKACTISNWRKYGVPPCRVERVQDAIATIRSKGYRRSKPRRDTRAGEISPAQWRWMIRIRNSVNMRLPSKIGARCAVEALHRKGLVSITGVSCGATKFGSAMVAKWKGKEDYVAMSREAAKGGK